MSMKMTRASSYALHALAYMAESGQDKPVQSHGGARRTNSPPGSSGGEGSGQGLRGVGRWAGRDARPSTLVIAIRARNWTRIQNFFRRRAPWGAEGLVRGKGRGRLRRAALFVGARLPQDLGHGRLTGPPPLPGARC